MKPEQDITRSDLNNESELTFEPKIAYSLLSKVAQSYKETVFIATSVSVFGIFLLATFYGMYHFLTRRRRMMMTVTSISLPVPDYFMRPREPLVLLHEVSLQNAHQEPVSYWQRPIKPITTDADLYSFVIW